MTERGLSRCAGAPRYRRIYIGRGERPQPPARLAQTWAWIAWTRPT